MYADQDLGEVNGIRQESFYRVLGKPRPGPRLVTRLLPFGILILESQDFSRFPHAHPRLSQ